MIKKTESLKLARLQLGKEVELVVDRPLGSKHPQYEYMYQVNYGYVKGVVAPDGEDLDAYYLGEDVPLSLARGICIAIVHRLNDDDDKLVVVPHNKKDITDQEIVEKTHFQEQWFQSIIIRS